MSASLVGSEMCIRDRPPRGAITGSAGVQAAPSPRLLYCASPPACCCASVSYTHLTLPTICSV
eukprot:11892879-Alexandrium_andersonii.AAC.1